MPLDTDSNPRKALVRSQLIDKAAELFAKRGYARTTMHDLAEELGLKRSSLYHYFRNKEEILDALIEEQTVAPTQMLRGLIDDPGERGTPDLRDGVRSVGPYIRPQQRNDIFRGRRQAKCQEPTSSHA